MKKAKRRILLLHRYKWLLAETLWLSARYRFQILHRPFAKIAPVIGVSGLETAEETLPEPITESIMEVAWAVDAVCKRTPWESKCLVRALTAKKLLNGRGYPCTLYMGVKMEQGAGKELGNCGTEQPNTQPHMVAHAWLRCGKIFVSGGDGSMEYAVTAVYGDRV